jgi:hypothetical protein
MSRRRLYELFGSILGGLFLIVMSVLPASAATTPTSVGSGLKISPVVTNLTVDAGQTQDVIVYVQNVTSATITVQALVNDFTDNNNETGTPDLLLNNQFAPTHSLKRFVAPIGNVTLLPGQQKSVTVEINIPSGNSGGGYYGAIRFVPVSTNSGGTVSLTASLASLILVKVPGTYKESVDLLSFDAENSGGSSVLFTSNKSLVAAARFQNTGAVQEQPFGKVLLESGNKVLASYEINNTNPRGNVLPNSIRKFTVNLNKVGAFGQFTLIGNFGYGTNGQLLSAKTTFYVIPYPIIGLIILIILIILFLIVAIPRWIRGHDQRVIQRTPRR